MLVDVTHWVALYSKLSPNYLWYIDEVSLCLLIYLFISLIIWVKNICSRNFLYDALNMILLWKISLDPNLHLLFLLLCAFKRKILVVLVSRKGKKEQERLLLRLTKIATLFFFFFLSFLSFLSLGYGLLRDPFICRQVV